MSDLVENPNCWYSHAMPHSFLDRYAKMLIDDGLYKPKKKKKLLKALGNRWCPEPSIDNGNVELTCGRGFAQTAKYTCNVGYQLTPKTSEERLCLGNRTWSGEAPECVPGNRLSKGKLNVSILTRLNSC